MMMTKTGHHTPDHNREQTTNTSNHETPEPISPLSHGFSNNGGGDDDARSPVGPPSASPCSSGDRRDDSRVCSPMMLRDVEGMEGEVDEVQQLETEVAAPAASPTSTTTSTTAAFTPPCKKTVDEQEESLTQKQPFFVFDWLDDLVPKDHDAERLAELLQTPIKSTPSPTQRSGETNNNKKNGEGDMQEQQQPSPIFRFFAQFNRGDGGFIFAAGGGRNCHNSSPQRRTSSAPTLRLKRCTGDDGSNINYNEYSDDDETIQSSPSYGLLSQLQTPSTPKSSNRRKSLLRRRYHHEHHHHHGVGGETYGLGDDDDEHNFYESMEPPVLPIPTRLETQLDLAAAATATADGADSNANFATTVDSPGPIFDLETNNDDDFGKEELQRRYRNHLLRRKHRQKNPCIVRRSLEMAQAWNMKGLQKAHEASANGSARSWEDALLAWNNALEIITALLGKKHVQYAMVMNNRGIAMGRLGRFDEAFQALNVALEIRQSRLVPPANQPGTSKNKTKRHSGTVTSANNTSNMNNSSTFEEVISTLHNLANVYQAKGDLSTALSVLGYARGLCCESIDIGTGNGSTDPAPAQIGIAATCSLQSARLCVAMGHIYWEVSQFEDAYDAYQDAMYVYEYLAVESTRRNIMSSRSNTDNINRQTIEEFPDYEVVMAELLSLRVDVQELDVLQEQQRCNQQEQLRLQRQLESERQVSTTYSGQTHSQCQNDGQYSPRPIFY